MTRFHFIIAAMIMADLAWGLWAYWKLTRRVLRCVAVTFAMLQACGLAAILLSRHVFPELESMIPRWWSSAILVWHILVVLGWMFWRLMSGLWAGASAVKQVIAPSRQNVLPEASKPMIGSWTRREFIRTTAIFTPPMLCLGSSALAEEQLERFRIRRIKLVMTDLPPALDGLTIAHVTDTHVGRFTRGRMLEEIVDATNRLNADVVAFTGDLIDNSLRALPAALEMTKALRAKHLVVACEGNHDLFDNPQTFYRDVEKSGLLLLRGNSTQIEVRGQKLEVLGMPWANEESVMARDASALLAKRDPLAWPLVLAHHPHAWDHLPGIPLTLSGHTHGGQLMLNQRLGVGSLFYRYWSGLYRNQDRSLVVSNGTGNWFPVRIQAPAEIVHLTLRRGTA